MLVVPALIRVSKYLHFGGGRSAPVWGLNGSLDVLFAGCSTCLDCSGAVIVEKKEDKCLFLSKNFAISRKNSTFAAIPVMEGDVLRFGRLVPANRSRFSEAYYLLEMV